MLALLYLTLALVLAGALALRAVTQQSLYSAVWETIAGAACSPSAPPYGRPSQVLLAVPLLRRVDTIAGGIHGLL